MRFTVHNLPWLLRDDERFRLRNWTVWRVHSLCRRHARQRKNPDEQRGQRCRRNQRVDPIFHGINQRMQKLSPQRDPLDVTRVSVADWLEVAIILAQYPVLGREEINNLRS